MGQIFSNAEEDGKNVHEKNKLGNFFSFLNAT
jgi:hypothetical protein